ncbi:hypothetical protein [Peribacillus huizhouensis]|uniref:Anti-sigma regulatory factor (Ser/Thr protein kinase) n=1 Tax=Peribacillus huizhouensis TaxID=1501239 RepID=A0ABR6CL04_9BACI|nr:hypothetical protein [Peribacillus huizhouensis]MBA9025667.1 anti-sigma regulatory factor (Ser/Thr protein kinase) [Peribacillus huizhouensis]
MNSELLNQETFKNILTYAYKRGNEVKDMTVTILVEEIKQQFIAAISEREVGINTTTTYIEELEVKI